MLINQKLTEREIFHDQNIKTQKLIVHKARSPAQLITLKSLVLHKYMYTIKLKITQKSL